MKKTIKKYTIEIKDSHLKRLKKSNRIVQNDVFSFIKNFCQQNKEKILNYKEMSTNLNFYMNEGTQNLYFGVIETENKNYYFEIEKVRFERKLLSSTVNDRGENISKKREVQREKQNEYTFQINQLNEQIKNSLNKFLSPSLEKLLTQKVIDSITENRKFSRKIQVVFGEVTLVISANINWCDYIIFIIKDFLCNNSYLMKEEKFLSFTNKTTQKEKFESLKTTLSIIEKSLSKTPIIM